MENQSFERSSPDESSSSTSDATVRKGSNLPYQIECDLNGERKTTIHITDRSESINQPLDYIPEYSNEPSSGPMRYIEVVQTKIGEVITQNQRAFHIGVYLLFISLFHCFLGLALAKNYKKAEPLLILTIIVWVYIIYRKLFVRLLGKKVKAAVTPYMNEISKICQRRIVKIAVYATMISLILIFIIIDTTDDRQRLVGLAGMSFLILLMVLCSHSPSDINWRPVIVGFSLQFVIALIVLRWDWGERQFNEGTELIIKFLDFTNNGTDFVYGFLASPPNICGMDPVFAFKAIQVILYFGAVVALLYYYGIMQFFLKKMAWLVQLTLGTTATESVNACACVFLGQSEAPLLIRPYVIKMTASEIHAIMTSGFSCIAGSMFAAYIAFGACPTYLLSATVMSAPGSLACSKILFPETEESQLKTIEDLELPPGTESNALECISNGAIAGIEIIMAILANLIVFLALLAFVNSTISYAGDLVGYSGWSLELFLGYLFYPLAFIMGVTESEETLKVAGLMGTKTMLNEFIAYRQLGEMIYEHKLSERSAMIATYALCGFSNLGSVGIQLGVLGGIAPTRKALFSKIAFRALFAGSISCFMTASLAGILVTNPTKCMPNVQTTCFDVDKYKVLLNETSSSLASLLTHTEL
ncbi:unnamed protein product [Bursaphelenchus okinawaensis]|uniref:Sodium/nucleoside cotransporter n=1 Tax=Bursaphelenchus okinawaensis TaxID=465554 RepID=A0A811KBH5_9BILA|nr:unnamed protein product [Bursaphelenchus okinawaensis]CAG9097415.1 unnamed protein product [Bursaphelenchus okinawaensis]